MRCRICLASLGNAVPSIHPWDFSISPINQMVIQSKKKKRLAEMRKSVFRFLFWFGVFFPK